MKQRWDKLAARVDALTLRERAMVFGAAAAVLVFGIYYLLLNPLFLRQAALVTEIRQQQGQIATIDLEITQKVTAYANDPDLATRQSLEQNQREQALMSQSLVAVQRDLVAPEKMVPLLENILRSNGKLRLLSLKTLPVSGISEATGPAEVSTVLTTQPPGLTAVAATPAPAIPAAVPKAHELLYRHGVEIVVQGSYADMVRYMQELQSMPTRVFWGKARLDASKYPESTLSLTLYTLSLDQKWMKL